MFDDDGNIKCQLEFSYFRTGQNVQEFKEMAHMSLWVMYLPETRKEMHVETSMFSCPNPPNLTDI